MDPKSSHEELQPDQGKSVAHKNRFQIARDLFFACKDYVLKDDRLRNILVDAGTLSYLIYTFKLLFKFSMMFRSQPHAVTVGFTVPSVAIYAFIQRYAPRKLEETKSTTLQAAVDVTILAGAFVCTFTVWLIFSFVGELGAAVFLAFNFGIRFVLFSSYI
ncbi:hypothetical protein GGU10DRAFT_382001 [Lentinula aff. detonsa]|uniref:Uncharacterized protein n=1 Tax=Lentinula aff. detonsa TaxID=2804958 RepID=A0AA38NH58_9AGAR|nr:hypothetical protein GGU10DRAFT_382001 [Lentinula aff. detonsa]